jgi:hypothetical protein
MPSVTHYVFNVYQHANAAIPSDPNIGFWVTFQPGVADSKGNVTAAANSIPTPVPAGIVAQVQAGASQPFATQAAAQAWITAAIAAQSAINAQQVQPGSASDTLVAGPFTV